MTEPFALTGYGVAAPQSSLSGYGVPTTPTLAPAPPTASRLSFTPTIDASRRPRGGVPLLPTTAAPLVYNPLYDRYGGRRWSRHSSRSSSPVSAVHVTRLSKRSATSFLARCVFVMSAWALVAFAYTRNPRAFRAGLLPGLIAGAGIAIVARATEAMVDRRRGTSLFNLPAKHFASCKTRIWTRLAYLILIGAAAYAVHAERQYLPLVAGTATGLLAGEFLAFQVTKRI